jgi:hypothetical protein
MRRRAILVALVAAASITVVAQAGQLAHCQPGESCAYLPITQGGGYVPPTATAVQPTAIRPTPTRDPATCDPSYPSVCVPPPPPDLNCGDILYRRFTVLPPDPHNFDRDNDGIGCEGA